MKYFKAWSRCDRGTWALPLYVTYLGYGAIWGPGGKIEASHIVSVRVLCFGIFIEWSR